MRFLFVIFLQLACFACFAQARVVQGTVIDSVNQPIANVFVTILSETDTLSAKSDSKGNFTLRQKRSGDFYIEIKMVEFEPYKKAYTLNETADDSITLDPIKLKAAVKDLQEVVLTPTNPITVKEDTIEYRTDAYKVKDGAVVEEVLKKLPGITVDKEGNVTAQGKEIQAVRVNGKDYFGGDVKTATQNLPAGIVENIQIIDYYGDKAKHTGVKSGEAEKILNINIKKDKNKGGFGQATVAGGTQDRYMLSLSANNFDDEKQVSFLATLNNINATGYEFNGVPRGATNRSGFSSNAGGGINQLGSLAINYRNSWDKKFMAYGTYGLVSRNSANTGSTYQQDFNPANVNTIKSSNLSESQNKSHRISWTLEYNIDSSNYLKIYPSISTSNSSGSQRTTAEYTRPQFYTFNEGSTQNLAEAPAWGTDLFYLHRFKKGRTFSLGANINHAPNEQTRDVLNNYYDVDSTSLLPFSKYVQQNQSVVNSFVTTRTGLNMTLTEKLGESGLLEASYVQTTAASQTTREVNDVDASTGQKTRNNSQSNEYKYQFTTNKISIALSTRKKQYNFYLGIGAQPSLLTGRDIRRNISTRNVNFNLVPFARIGYKFAPGNSLTASYNGSSREPGFTQLQPVTDSSNIKNIITGNANLQPEFTNKLALQYNRVEILTGRSLFANLSFNQVQNKIVSSRINDASGTSRTTTFVNANGFHGFSGSVTFTQPFAKKKFVVALNASGNYDNNISFTDNQRNTGNNWTFRPGLNLRVDLPDVLDLNVGANYVFNKNTTRYLTYVYASKVKTIQFTVDGKYYFLKNWTFGYDLAKNIFIGYEKSFNTNPSLLNLYVERKLLKNNKGTLRFQGFDLFNENTGISRTINGTTIMDVEVNRLSRYFMLSFNYRLQKFGRK